MRGKEYLRLFTGITLALAVFLAAFAAGGCGSRKGNWWGTGAREGGGEEDGAPREGLASLAYVSGDHVYLADLAEGEVRRLTSRPGAYADLAFSPHAGRIAATLVVGDAMPQLVVINVESGEVTDISWNNQDLWRAWSGAGVKPWYGTVSWANEKVLYATAVREESGRFRPCTVKVDLSMPSVEVVCEDARNPALDPGGSQLAYVRRPDDWDEAQGAWGVESPGDLVILDLKSGREREIKVTMDGVERGYVYEASFSPDGKHMAVVCLDEPDTALYYTDLEGRAYRALDFTGVSGRFGHPSFSPGGEWLLYHLASLGPSGENLGHKLKAAVTSEADSNARTLGEGRDPAFSPVPVAGQDLEDLERLLAGSGEGDEEAAVVEAMIAFVKRNAAPGLEFKIVNLAIRGNEAVGVAVCTNQRLESPLVIMRKGPQGWEGVDMGTGIEPPSWYPY